MTRGFTLLEVLVVLAVLALLTGLALPYGESAFERLRAERATDDIVTALERARDTAVSRNMPVRVTFNERDGSWEVDGQGFRRLPDGVALAGPQRGDDGRAAIVFLPDGTSSGGQVVVSARDTAWSVAVELLTGEVRRRHAGPAR